MSQKAPSSLVIVKRSIKKGHGHHGGSWKVAYADFVTAMMAFFLVMWIVGMDDQTKQAVEGYFSNPVGYKHGYGTGSSPLGSGATPTRMQTDRLKLILHSAEQKSFEQMAERLSTRVDSLQGSLGAAKVEVTVTNDGLRIELVEPGSGDTFFSRGSARFSTVGATAVTIVAEELAALRNPIVLEGHTDAAGYDDGATYTNWELSSDRANAARRVLEAAGVTPARVVEVRGFAATRPRVPLNPMAGENRRITILLPFTTPPASSDEHP